MNGIGALGADGDRRKYLPWFPTLPGVPVTRRGTALTAWKHVTPQGRRCDCISQYILHPRATTMKHQSCPSLLNPDEWDLLWLCWRRQRGAG